MINLLQLLLSGSIIQYTVLMKMMDQYNLYWFSVTHHQLILLYRLEIMITLQLVSRPNNITINNMLTVTILQEEVLIIILDHIMSHLLLE